MFGSMGSQPAAMMPGLVCHACRCSCLLFLGAGATLMGGVPVHADRPSTSGSVPSVPPGLGVACMRMLLQLLMVPCVAI